MRYFIVYSSPAGSTRKVAGAIEKALNPLPEDNLFSLDLGQKHDGAPTLQLIRETPADDLCLFIGSPVYRDFAVTPVMKFIQALPAVARGFAVPFVTWGHVCSGIALWEMAVALRERGFLTVGAFKVPSAHSMMWRIEEPFGRGQPDEASQKAVADFVRSTCTRLKHPPFPGVDLDTLVDQPPQWAAEMREKLAAPRLKFPKIVNTEKCTQCGICRDECPAGAIELNPYPELGDACFDCFTCLRLCPEEAIESAPTVEEICALIRKRRELMNEEPRVKFFLG